MMRPLLAAPLAALLCTLALAGCSKPEKPEKERPPSPQAGVSADVRPQVSQGTTAAAVTQAIRSPIERAQGTEATTLEAAKKQDASIDAQTSGQDPQPAQ
ncbi:hypothetical protein LVB87_03930 [Lysobacter sp. KIS68-7]|uniref:hypothetical protein n=1 Tax=Lysobacter sp. KIS68-7 TaxID=2904252 RepID=UPI001E2E9076|nr:hypothetical protein [Lysobacter sp. KIS68-7]UHQ20320.1 hypothetical protein LVB87_03930 [Lysobacter sp. KIS68-7]